MNLRGQAAKKFSVTFQWPADPVAATYVAAGKGFSSWEIVDVNVTIFLCSPILFVRNLQV